MKRNTNYTAFAGFRNTNYEISWIPKNYGLRDSEIIRNKEVSYISGFSPCIRFENIKKLNFLQRFSLK